MTLWWSISNSCFKSSRWPSFFFLCKGIPINFPFEDILTNDLPFLPPFCRRNKTLKQEKRSLGSIAKIKDDRRLIKFSTYCGEEAAGFGTPRFPDHRKHPRELGKNYKTYLIPMNMMTFDKRVVVLTWCLLVMPSATVSERPAVHRYRARKGVTSHCARTVVCSEFSAFPGARTVFFSWIIFQLLCLQSA